MGPDQKSPLIFRICEAGNGRNPCPVLRRIRNRVFHFRFSDLTFPHQRLRFYMHIRYRRAARSESPAPRAAKSERRRTLVGQPAPFAFCGLGLKEEAESELDLTGTANLSVVGIVSSVGQAQTLEAGINGSELTGGGQDAGAVDVGAAGEDDVVGV